MLLPLLVVAEYQLSQASQLIWAHWPLIGGRNGCTGKMLAFYSNVGTLLCNQRSHQKMIKAKSARNKHGHCYLKVINLNLGRRCGKTEIVCHRSFLMLLAPAQQSIQLLICHRSRWRLLFIGCHWWLLILLTPAKQGIQLWQNIQLLNWSFFASI